VATPPLSHACTAAGRAGEHGRSVEAEVRAILDTAVDLPEHNFLLSLHASMAEVGGVNLDMPSRTDQPHPVDLS
jgi:plasmid stability protein